MVPDAAFSADGLLAFATALMIAFLMGRRSLSSERPTKRAKRLRR